MELLTMVCLIRTLSDTQERKTRDSVHLTFNPAESFGEVCPV